MLGLAEAGHRSPTLISFIDRFADEPYAAQISLGPGTESGAVVRRCEAIAAFHLMYRQAAPRHIRHRKDIGA